MGTEPNDDDAIALIRKWVADSPLKVEVLDVDRADGERTLAALEVTTRSPLGALARHTGGLLVDHGWLRVLGGGCPRLPRALDRWNGAPGPFRCDRGVLVGDDVLGGFFAWFRKPRTIHYLAPDTLEWEDNELGYSDWLRWCLSDRLAKFYESERWLGWEEEVRQLAPDRGLLIYPPLFADGPPIAGRSRGPVAVEELWNLALEFGRKFRGLPTGAKFTIVVK
jgi:hypothetical protein